MTNQLARIDWAWLLGAAAQDLSGLAKQTGTVARWRKVCSGEVLLWLCVLHATAALSLRSTSFLSQSTGRCEFNDSSLLHRLRAAGPFLRAVLNHVLFRSAAAGRARGLKRVLRLQDATVLCVPGSRGADFRLHTVYVLIEAALIDRLNNRMVELSAALADDAFRPSVSLYRLTVVHHLQILLAVCAGFRVKAERLLCAIGALREGRRKRSDSLSLITQTQRRINAPHFEPPLPVC